MYFKKKPPICFSISRIPVLLFLQLTLIYMTAGAGPLLTWEPRGFQALSCQKWTIFYALEKRNIVSVVADCMEKTIDRTVHCTWCILRQTACSIYTVNINLLQAWYFDISSYNKNSFTQTYLYSTRQDLDTCHWNSWGATWTFYKLLVELLLYFSSKS